MKLRNCFYHNTLVPVPATIIILLAKLAYSYKLRGTAVKKKYLKKRNTASGQMIINVGADYTWSLGVKQYIDISIYCNIYYCNAIQ